MKNDLKVKRSIKWKMMSLISIIIIALMLILTTIQITSQKKVLETELNKRISLMTEHLMERGKSFITNLSEQVEKDLASFNFSGIVDTVKAATENNREVEYAVLTDKSGKIYVHTRQPELVHSVLEGDTAKTAMERKKLTVTKNTLREGGAIEIFSPIQVSAQPWGVLKLVYTLRHLENEIQSSKGQIRYEIKRMILNTLITTAGFIFISLLLVYMLSTRFSSPLIYLAKCAGDISRGDFSVTRHIRIRSMDEVGVLSAAFIGMGEDLKRSYDRLEEYNRTLEQKVRERTRELDEKNHRLLEVNHQLEHTLEELRQSQAQLVQSEKMAALGHLIAGIAHEINTPLGVIRGAANNITSGLKEALEKFPNIFRTLRDEKLDAFVDLLQESISRDDRLSSREARQTRKKISRELENHEISATDNIADYLVDIGLTTNYESYLIILREPDAIMILHVAYRLTGLLKNNRNIITAVERASKIVFALKKFAHYDHVGEKVSADIVDGLETVLTLYHNQLKHGVEITKNYEEIPPISCHPDELNQVWTNLIHNALQAMENKGRLDLSVFRQNGQVVIAISDTGPGIPEEIRHRIFEPFFTTKAAGEGSGLGLDISKKIIEKHQGSIDVESQPGKTTFRVILPVLEPGEKQDKDI